MRRQVFSFRLFQVWMFAVALVAASSGAALAEQSSLPQTLLFTETQNGTIPIYDLSDPARGPVATITGLSCIQGQMVVDKSGDLFVVNNGSGGQCFYVSEYVPPYNAAPIILQTIWQGQVFWPTGITVDASGTVYVSNVGAYFFETPAIFVYPTGSTVPTQAIRLTSAKFNSLANLALDQQGNVYAVAMNWNSATSGTVGTDVFMLPHGSTTLKELGLEGLYAVGSTPNGVTLDAAGNLYVSVPGALPLYILEFKPGQRTAAGIIDHWSLTPSWLEPTGLDTGPDGNLYVGVGCNGGTCPLVEGFKPGHDTPFELVGATSTSPFFHGVATAPNPKL